MGKKKGKKDVEKKAALAARKEAKQEKSARKRLAKEGVVADDGGEEDEIDKVLQAYKSRDKATSVGENEKSVLESLDTEFPLPRANASLCGVASDKKDYLYLFGGEYFDGVSNIVLDDLLRYEPSKNEWKQVLTQPRPAPRCAHSCVSYKQYLYVFGGELATADQYHHYRDLWKFDTNTLKWTEVKSKTSPSARSGHVCCLWKHYMILFGGFFEALRETKWYNDVHIFNLQTETWMDLPQSRLAAKPEARSACNIASFGSDKLIIHGGFSKLKVTGNTSETKVHSDSWVLNLNPILQEKPPTWERWMSSTKGTSPKNPNGRAGTASISYKSRMLVFGGVVDSEQYHHKVDSVFYNDLMAMDIDRRKWFPLRVKNGASQSKGRRRKEKLDDETKEADEINVEDEVEEEVLVLNDDDIDENDEGQAGWDLDMLRSNMFAFVDGDGNIVYEKIEVEEDANEKMIPETVREEKMEEDDEEGEEEKEDEKEEEKEEEKTNEEEKKAPKPTPLGLEMDGKQIVASSVMAINRESDAPEAVERSEPLPRINASVVVRGHALYVFGGILEVGDREVTLDDMWTLDLRKRDAWNCLWSGVSCKWIHIFTDFAPNIL